MGTPRRGRGAWLVAALTLAACAGAEDEAPLPGSGTDPSRAESTGEGDAPAPVPEAAGPAHPLAALTPAVPPFRPERERGVGVVHLPEPAVEADIAGGDTLVLRASPSVSAPPVARLAVDPDGAWSLAGAVPSPGGARGAALEFGYEALGLPALEVRADGWVRALYAMDGAGRPLDGWAWTGDGDAALTTWPDLLPGQPLWFLGTPAFHDAPDGAPLSLRLAPGGGTPGADYIMWPLEARGDWLRVEVVTPSDYCTDPRQPRRDTTWIRYLDAGGRPRAWFYTRGC